MVLPIDIPHDAKNTNSIHAEECYLRVWQNMAQKAMYDDCNDYTNIGIEQNGLYNSIVQNEVDIPGTLPPGRPIRNRIPNRRYFDDEIVN